MSDEVLERLETTAARLIREIEARPRVDSSLGAWLKVRLAEDDWIKSPELVNFTRRLTDDLEPYWKPDQESIDHMARQLAKFSPEATSLDALEHNLEAFDKHSVGGIRNWFKEIGGESGYWLDKRIHSVAWEMLAVATLFEWSGVSKLRRSNKTRVPDYLIDMGTLTLVVECKTIFGRVWPLVVFRTVIRALRRLGGMTETDQTMFLLNPLATTKDVEEEIADLSIEDIVSAIGDVVGGSSEQVLTPNLRLVPRTEIARRLRLETSYRAIQNDQDFEHEVATWQPSIDSIKQEAVAAWDQCGRWVATPTTIRLDVATIAGEFWLGHPDFSTHQAVLQQWLTDEIWPIHPGRAIMARFSEIPKPVWFVSPMALEELDRQIAAETRRDN
ncbi:MAG: hypothetical protein IH864_03730 [Chloroflexi bacterium]|nr:hypothetical protein [Chloroflexota bacterium]